MTRSVLAHAGTWILDGQAGMSKQGDSPDYEYWWPLREYEVRSNQFSWMMMSAPADMSVYQAESLVKAEKQRIYAWLRELELVLRKNDKWLVKFWKMLEFSGEKGYSELEKGLKTWD